MRIEKNYVPCNCLHLISLKLASVAIASVSAYLAADGSLTIPVFLMLAIFSFVVFGHMEKINNATHVLQVIGPTLDKLDKIKQVKFIDSKGKDIEVKNFSIEMKDVRFSYDKRTILDNVTFNVPQNTTTAIVGPSGSGKTTICSLIARFYNVYLFNDTIVNNIKFGKPDAAMEEIIEAARKARCHDFITYLPDGHNTMVGEGGSTLSGGEKQRISIARAILKNAPVVILDEATASVDPENEHYIQEAISALTHGKTIIVIAHRLATIENADQILVLDGGRIVQKGTHGQLLTADGIYSRFHAIRKQAEGWSIA